MVCSLTDGVFTDLSQDSGPRHHSNTRLPVALLRLMETVQSAPGTVDGFWFVGHWVSPR